MNDRNNNPIDPDDLALAQNLCSIQKMRQNSQNSQKPTSKTTSQGKATVHTAQNQRRATVHTARSPTNPQSRMAHYNCFSGHCLLGGTCVNSAGISKLTAGIMKNPDQDFGDEVVGEILRKDINAKVMKKLRGMNNACEAKEARVKFAENDRDKAEKSKNETQEKYRKELAMRVAAQKSEQKKDKELKTTLEENKKLKSQCLKHVAKVGALKDFCRLTSSVLAAFNIGIDASGVNEGKQVQLWRCYRNGTQAGNSRSAREIGYETVVHNIKVDVKDKMDAVNVQKEKEAAEQVELDRVATNTGAGEAVTAETNDEQPSQVRQQAAQYIGPIMNSGTAVATPEPIQVHENATNVQERQSSHSGLDPRRRAKNQGSHPENNSNNASNTTIIYSPTTNNIQVVNNIQYMLPDHVASQIDLLKEHNDHLTEQKNKILYNYEDGMDHVDCGNKHTEANHKPKKVLGNYRKQFKPKPIAAPTGEKHVNLLAASNFDWSPSRFQIRFKDAPPKSQDARIIATARWTG